MAELGHRLTWTQQYLEVREANSCSSLCPPSENSNEGLQDIPISRSLYLFPFSTLTIARSNSGRLLYLLNPLINVESGLTPIVDVELGPRYDTCGKMTKRQLEMDFGIYLSATTVVSVNDKLNIMTISSWTYHHPCHTNKTGAIVGIINDQRLRRLSLNIRSIFSGRTIVAWNDSYGTSKLQPDLEHRRCEGMSNFGR